MRDAIIRRRSPRELKATNESLKSLQTQLELAYASTASSGQPVAGGGGGISGISGIGGISGLAGASVIGLGSVSGGAGAGGCGGGTVLGGSVAVPGGVPGSTTLTAIMETKDARITTLEKEVALLEAELQRIKECGGRLREQLLKAISVPSSSDTEHQRQQLSGGTTQSTGLGGQQQPGTLALARGPSMMTSLVPYGGHASSAALTSSLLAGSTGGTTTGSGGMLGVGGGSSCLAGISSGTTTGVVNPYTDRYATDYHPHQLHHHQHHHHHLHQQHQLQLQQQQQHQQMQQHLKQIEPAAAGALALHAHTFNKHDLNFKRQVSFFINNVRIEKNDAV
ncbi:PE-PGRS family protein PE_PGRS3-like [Cardiocondyla obscurior]|uniref:PE-PGRS family protein PE_PGRS3-like n=1 Tax=Cardiocondyla obscurior TaxID=286306 RepID=UPI0039656590